MPLILASVSEVFARALIAVASGGAVCVAYGVLVERRWFRLAEYDLPTLPSGTSPLAILHLSDLHFVRSDRRKAEFLSSLPPADVTVITGDLLGEIEAVRAVADALRPARGRAASYFVLGSNDYYAPKPLNYAAYFRWRRGRRKGTWGRSEDLIARLRQDGWQLLRNRRASLSVDSVRLEVTGLDDPHIQRQDFRVAPRIDPEAFGLAVVHSPDVAPELAALGYDLIVAGHTHGGQVRMPFVGALVTNGSTPSRLAMGLSRLGRAYMHVSPGLGTSKYAPFRFLCRPEATLLRLVPAVDGHAGQAAPTASS